MNLLNRFFAVLLVMLTAPTLSLAEENQKDFANYTVHHSVFNSDFLTPDVAKSYGITRSKALGLVNITVIDKTTNKPVTANVMGNAYNLAGQNKDIAFREIREENAVYYLANFRFSNEEKLSFKLTVKPDGQSESLALDFTHTMYVSR